MKTRLKTTIHPDYEHLRDFIMQLPEVMDTQGEYIYGGQRNLIKMFIAPDGTRLNVKRYHRPHFINKYVYSFSIRKPKGRRAFEYPEKLRGRGISTPQEVAYLELRQGCMLRESFFISLQCNNDIDIRHLHTLPADEQKAVLIHMARFTADMHERGVLHKDYTMGNILCTKEGNAYGFTLVDINRMRFGKVSVKTGCKSLKGLWKQKAMFIKFVEAYAAARRTNTYKAVDIALKARERYWKRFIRRHKTETPAEL